MEMTYNTFSVTCGVKIYLCRSTILTSAKTYLFLYWLISRKLGKFNRVFEDVKWTKQNSIFSYSVPTPSITEHITTVWAPFSLSKSRLFRIDSTPELDADYRADVSRFWNEEIPSVLQSSRKKNLPTADVTSGLYRKEEL